MDPIYLGIRSWDWDTSLGYLGLILTNNFQLDPQKIVSPNYKFLGLFLSTTSLAAVVCAFITHAECLEYSVLILNTFVTVAKSLDRGLPCTWEGKEDTT